MIERIVGLGGHGAVCLLVVLLSCTVLHGAGEDASVERDVAYAHHLLADLCHNPPILSVEMTKLSRRLMHSQASSPFFVTLTAIQTAEQSIQAGLGCDVVSPEAVRFLCAVYRVYLI